MHDCQNRHPDDGSLDLTYRDGVWYFEYSIADYDKAAVLLNAPCDGVRTIVSPRGNSRVRRR